MLVPFVYDVDKTLEYAVFLRIILKVLQIVIVARDTRRVGRRQSNLFQMANGDNGHGARVDDDRIIRIKNLLVTRRNKHRLPVDKVRPARGPVRAVVLCHNGQRALTAKCRRAFILFIEELGLGKELLAHAINRFNISPIARAAMIHEFAIQYLQIRACPI